MKLLCRKTERKIFYSRSLRKLFYCDVHQHLRGTCQIHWKRNVYTRSFFEKRERKVFVFSFTLFSHGIFMRTMFHVLDGMCRFSRSCMYTFSTVSCVVQWKANIFFFPPSKYCFFVRIILNFRAWTFSAAARVLNRKANEKYSLPTNDRKVFQLSTLFRNYFFVFFIFPSFPFSRLRTFHWLGTTQRYLLLKSSSFIPSLFPHFLVVVKTTKSMMWIS